VAGVVVVVVVVVVQSVEMNGAGVVLRCCSGVVYK